MPESIGDESVELRHYWTVVWRRRLVVAACALLGVVIAGGYVYLTPVKTTATALVQINVISSDQFSSGKPDSQLIDAQTEAELARSTHVLSDVADKIGHQQTLSDIRNATMVDPLADATIVRISFTAPSVKRAQSGADDIARAYLKYRSQIANDKIGRVVTDLTERRNTLRTQLVAVNGRIAVASVGSQRAVQANSDRQVLNLELDSLFTQLNQIGSIDTSGGTLIGNAADNGVSVSPSKKLMGLTGLLMGLLVGLVAAFVVNALDKRLFDRRDARLAGGGELLARLSGDVTIPAGSGSVDSFRALRERLLASLGRRSWLVVADLTKGMQPSDVGVNLAISFAETRRQVQLVLPDHPPAYLDHLRTTLDLHDVNGSDIASSRVVPGLQVRAQKTSEQTGVAGALASIASGRSARSRLTIVSLPPSSDRSLRLAAGRAGHAVVLVVQQMTTTTSDVSELVDDLDAIDAVVYGTVMVARHRVVRFTDADAAQPAGTAGREADLADEDTPETDDDEPGGDANDEGDRAERSDGTDEHADRDGESDHRAGWKTAPGDNRDGHDRPAGTSAQAPQGGANGRSPRRRRRRRSGLPGSEQAKR